MSKYEHVDEQVIWNWGRTDEKLKSRKGLQVVVSYNKLSATVAVPPGSW